MTSLGRSIMKHVHVFHVIGLMCVAIVDRVIGASPSEDLAQFVISQNAESRAKLNSFSYNFTRTYEQTLPDGSVGMKAKFEGEWRQEGLQKWMQARRRSQYTNPPGTQDEERIAFMGLRSSGSFSKDTVNPNEFEYEDISRPSDLALKAIATGFSEDPMLSAFGTGYRLLSEEWESKPKGIVWQAERSNGPTGESVFTLRRILPAASGPVRDLVLTVDPQKGWMVTKQLWYTAKDHVEEESTIQPMRDPLKDVWYPSTVERIRRTAVSGGRFSRSELRIVVRELKPSVAFPPDQFTVASLGLPVGVRLMRHSLNNELITLVKAESGFRELSRGPLTPITVVPPAVASGSHSASTGVDRGSLRPVENRFGLWLGRAATLLLVLGLAALFGWFRLRKGGPSRRDLE